ncbi:hypothetical protein [Thermostichus vulcanus]|uniref:Uncharacterized protein n=1 Tax=Thermostichus vulcanus str. 'Rupite' TaxID=2813851 RepID=A0ABT0CDD9_THEVL|nr:hypothetical protein [Thermostichus vulcanus]MCJ2543340.1 hypothetical protein [Thermostichus vulcanus str. 'Rupite']
MRLEVGLNQETREPHPDLVAAVLNQGKTLGLSPATVLIDKAQTEHFFSASAAPITDLAGNISGVVVTFRSDPGESRRLPGVGIRVMGGV